MKKTMFLAFLLSGLCSASMIVDTTLVWVSGKTIYSWERTDAGDYIPVTPGGIIVSGLTEGFNPLPPCADDCGGGSGLSPYTPPPIEPPPVIIPPPVIVPPTEPARVTPEPATYFLTGGAFLIFLGAVRRRRKKIL